MQKNDFKLLVKEVIRECWDELAPKTKKNTVKLKKSELKESIKSMVIDLLLESEDADEKLKARLKQMKDKKSQKHMNRPAKKVQSKLDKEERRDDLA